LQIDPTNPKLNPRVLIVRLGAMGDVLHALPAVAMLRRSLPEARIGWVIEQRWRPLLCAPSTALAGSRSSGRPLVDEVHLVDTRRWRKQLLRDETRREFRAAVDSLRAAQYAAAIDMQGAIKSAVMARLSRAEMVLGFQHPRESIARWLYSSRFDGRRGAHVIEQNVELLQCWLEQIGLSRATSALQPGAALLPRDRASEAEIDARLRTIGVSDGPVRKPLAILNPGAGWAAKQWPPQRYAELALALGRRGMRSLVNYGPGEEALAKEVVEESRGHAFAFSCSISELIALARRAQLFIGGDTGPMHLAAMLGVKTVALFGPTDPARNGPYWIGTRTLRNAASNTSYSHRRMSDAGLEKISVDAVLEEVAALLD
jgi:heptosyltransferase-1